MQDRPEVIVCAGPPSCLLEGDEAISSAEAGCPNCLHMVKNDDGSWSEYKKQAN